MSALAEENPRRLSVAPMMGWTNRHGRFFLRLLSSRALLYSEMIPAAALLRMGAEKRERVLGFDLREKPLALQLGGSSPLEIAEAARMGEERGYDEININMGCPSPRVACAGATQRFGASLMRDPSHAARVFSAAREAVSVPVSVKCRLGLDEDDPRQTLPLFMESLIEAGCQTFIIHARKALLNGISPKDNRKIPPLQYEILHEMKNLYPRITIALNGGVENLRQAGSHLKHFDAVMIGRAACRTPFMLAAADSHIFHASAPMPSRQEVFAEFQDYALPEIQKGAQPSHVLRMAAGLFHGEKGAKSFRRALFNNMPLNMLSANMAA